MKHFFLALLFAGEAFAYQSSVTDRGQKMVLPSSSLELHLKNNPSHIDFNQTRLISQGLLQQWNAAAPLDLVISTTPALHEIEFVNDFSRYGSAVIGITEMSYGREGTIQRASIKLNNNYYFTLDKDSHRRGAIYLGDVLAHELGHLIGLGHSEVMNSTMFFESFPGQASLAADDIAGARSLYSSSGGRISGTVMGGNHVPVLGAQVKLISRISGEAIAGVSDERGRFSISGLELNDSYYLYVSPTVRINDLPSYFANTQNNFCPGSYRGGFFTTCGIESAGSAQAITLTSEKSSVEVGVVSLSCSLRSSPQYALSKLQEEGEPQLIWDSLIEEINEKNHIGYFLPTATWSKWDKFRVDLQSINSASKSLKINLIAQAFASSFEYEMQILKKDVVVANLIINDDVSTGTYHNNISYKIPLDFNPSQNDFEVRIRARSLAENCTPGVERPCRRWSYPAVNQFIKEEAGTYLLSLGLMQSGKPLFNTEHNLSDNSSCLQAPFTYAVSKNITALDQQSDKKQGEQPPLSCGTIDPPSAAGPPSAGLLSLCLGFMLACLSFKKNKKTLS